MRNAGDGMRTHALSCTVVQVQRLRIRVALTPLAMAAHGSLSLKEEPLPHPSIASPEHMSWAGRSRTSLRLVVPSREVAPSHEWSRARDRRQLHFTDRSATSFRRASMGFAAEPLRVTLDVTNGPAGSSLA